MSEEGGGDEAVQGCACICLCDDMDSMSIVCACRSARAQQPRLSACFLVFLGACRVRCFCHRLSRSDALLSLAACAPFRKRC